jgi:hypothetical protein
VKAEVIGIAQPILRREKTSSNHLTNNLFHLGAMDWQPNQEAIDWFAKNDIPLYGINTNPTQHEWTDSPKAYGQLMIDDIAIGVPLTIDKELSQRPFVDWFHLEMMLNANNLI